MPFIDPWFWAFLGAAGWAIAPGVMTRRLGSRLGFGVAVFVLAELPRLLLPLPFVSQPRLETSPLVIVLGAVVLAASLVLAAPVRRIVPLTRPDRREPLRTDGLYTVVRHPLMLCDVLWPLGWSLLFGSIVGIALAPAWLAIVWVLTHYEEDALVREYGDAYRDLQRRVPRLFPRWSGLGTARTSG